MKQRGERQKTGETCRVSNCDKNLQISFGSIR